MPVEGRDLTSGALWKRPTARGLTARSSNPKPMVERLRKELYGPTKEAPSGVSVGRSVKPVGEPDALIGHVRFDERDVETEHGAASEAPADERAGHG